MLGKLIATTKYNKQGYYLEWHTDFNEHMRKFDFIKDVEVKNDIQVILYSPDGKRIGDAICKFGSYGEEDDLWEIMIDVLPKNWGDAVMGYLTWGEVQKLFNKKIKQLESRV